MHDTSRRTADVSYERQLHRLSGGRAQQGINFKFVNSDLNLHRTMRPYHKGSLGCPRRGSVCPWTNLSLD